MPLTQEQIDEIRQKTGLTSLTPTKQNTPGKYDYLKEKKKTGIGKKVADFFTGSSQKFGKTIGTAASVIDPETSKMREETLSSTNKQVDDYIKIAQAEPDKKRAEAFLLAAQKLADTDKIDIFNNPEYQKTAKQVFGEGLGTALETLSWGTYGKVAGAASKVPTIAKPIVSPSKQILGAVKEGAKIGGVFGTTYGTSEAMQENKSALDIAKSGLKSGVMGAVTGGTISGAISAANIGANKALNKGKELTVKAKEKLGDVANEKLYQTSKDLVKMSPTMSKNEAKWNKNTPKFLIDEGVLPLIDNDGKFLNTTEATNALRQKYETENKIFQDTLKNSGKYISLDEYKQKLLASLGEDLKAKGSDLDDAVRYVNKEINSYKRNYADKGLAQGKDLLVDVSNFNKIKSGLWSKVSNFAPNQKDKLYSDLSYQMGHTAKEMIEDSLDDVAVKSTNARLGEFLQAIKVLESAQGKVVPGGFFGKQFARLAGTVIGSAGGVAGGVAGNIAGGAISDVVSNPRLRTGALSAIAKKLSK
jgi:hypothetical protein